MPSVQPTTDDTEEPETPTVLKTASKISRYQKLILFVLAAIVLILALVFLNRQKAKLTLPSPSTPPEIVVAPPLIKPAEVTDHQPVLLSCPLTPIICQNISNYSQDSLAVKFSKSTPLLAIFSGEAQTLNAIHPNADQTNENFLQTILINKDKGLIAYYSFKGEGSKTGPVKEGGIIASASGEAIKFEKDNSLILKIQQVEATQTALIKLSPKYFKK